MINCRVSALNVSAVYRVSDQSKKKSMFGPNYRKIRALNDVTFELHSGDRVGVIGKNGSGKSTLLKIIGGSLPPRQGELKIVGEKLSLLKRTSGLIPRATLYENAVLKAYSFGLSKMEAKEFANNSLELAQLESKANDPLKSLSTGMSGRFNLAINSQIVKQIVVMDEWVGTLDSAQTNNTGILDKLKAETEILILASHNQSLIRELCNKIVLLHDGELEYFGADIDFAYEKLESFFKQPVIDESHIDEGDEIKADASGEDASGEDIPLTGFSQIVSQPIEADIFVRPKKKVVINILNIGRISIPYMESLLNGKELDGYQVKFRPPRIRLKNLPVGSRVWVIVRDPISRFISSFYSRRYEGKPLFMIPWTEAEKSLYHRYETVNDLAEALSDENALVRFRAIQDMRDIGFLDRVYQHYYEGLTQDDCDKEIHAITDIEQIEAVECEVKKIFDVPTSLKLDDPDEALMQTCDWHLSDTGLENLRLWFQKENSYYDSIVEYGSKMNSIE